MEVMALCENLGCLPLAGGLFDQDPGFVRRSKLYYRLRAQKAEVEAELEKARSRPRDMK